MVCGDGGRERGRKGEREEGGREGRKEGGGVRKKERRWGKERGEGGWGRRCKDAAAAAVTPSDGRADGRVALREGQTDQQRV